MYFLINYQIISLIHFQINIIRESFIGKAIIGTSFNWIDFIFYIIRFGVAVMWLNKLNKIKFVKEKNLVIKKTI